MINNEQTHTTKQHLQQVHRTTNNKLPFTQRAIETKCNTDTQHVIHNKQHGTNNKHQTTNKQQQAPNDQQATNI